MPINIATGEVYLDREDLRVPGTYPLSWRRYFKTGIGSASDALGPGWTNPYFCTLITTEDGYVFCAPSGDYLKIPRMTDRSDSRVCAANYGAYLEVLAEHESVVVRSWDPESQDITRYVFPIVPAGESARLRAIEDASGQGLNLAWSNLGQLLRIEQRVEQRALILQYSKADRIGAISLRAPDGSLHPVCRYAYDELGRLSDAFDAADIPDQYSYDSMNRLVREVAKDGGVFTYRYDDHARCVRFSGLDRFNEKTLRYLEATFTTEVMNSYGHVARHRYLASGQLTDTWDETGRHTGTRYDVFGRIVAKINGLDAETVHQYDSRGNRCLIVDPLGAQTRFEFNLDRQTTLIENARGARWRRSYDIQGRLLAVEDPLGATWTLKYDPTGLLESMVNPLGASRRALPKNGILHGMTDWSGEWYLFELDPFGRLTKYTDPLGSSIKHFHDLRGNLNRIEMPDGQNILATYDQAGNLTSITRNDQLMLRWQFGPCGRMLQETDANGLTKRYSWGSEPGWLDSMIDQAGNTLDLYRDPSGRVIRQRSFDDTVSEFSYDDNGHCTRIVKPSGAWIDLTRDAMGRIAERVARDGSRSTFKHDPCGQLVSATNLGREIAITRDPVGRVILQKWDEHWISHRFDELDNIKATASSLGPERSFAYDHNSLRTSVSLGKQELIRIKRDALGQEIERQLPGGALLAQQFDSTGRLTIQALHTDSDVSRTGSRPARESTPSIGRSYTRDSYSQLIEIADRHWGDTRYAYDAAGRLLRAIIDRSDSEAFEYDSTNNLTRSTREKAGTPERDWDINYQPGNRIERCGSSLFTFDIDARLTSKVQKTADRELTWIYRWNDFDQLIELVTPDGMTWSYRYDALGRRFEKHGRDEQTFFVWDGAQLIHEYSNTESESISWVSEQFGSAPALTRQRGNDYAIICDHLGTPREAIDSTGRVVTRYRFSAYGESETSTSEPLKMQLRFQGQYADNESGLSYNFYRYYDPQLGRFIQQDLVRRYGFENLFAYTSDPLYFVDPFGLSSSPACPVLKLGTGKEMLGEAMGLIKAAPPAEREALAKGLLAQVQARATGDPWRASEMAVAGGGSAWSGDTHTMVIDSNGNVYSGPHVGGGAQFGIVNGQLGVQDWSGLPKRF